MVTVFPKWYYLDPLKTIKKVSLKREKKQKNKKNLTNPLGCQNFFSSDLHPCEYSFRWFQIGLALFGSLMRYLAFIGHCLH